MGTRGKVLAGIGAVVVLAAVITLLVIRAAIPPRPSLPYPAGQSLAHVRSNCKTGNEVFSCQSLQGPRSFMNITATDPRSASDALFAAMTSHGWKQDDDGLVAADYAEGGAAEDIQPVFCKPSDGCIGLFRLETAGFVLAWWQSSGS